MEKGLRIPQKERTKTTNSILISLMNQLEKVGLLVLFRLILLIFFSILLDVDFDYFKVTNDFTFSDEIRRGFV